MRLFLSILQTCRLQLVVGIDSTFRRICRFCKDHECGLESFREFALDGPLDFHVPEAWIDSNAKKLARRNVRPGFLSLYDGFYRKFPGCSNFVRNTVPANDTILLESLTSPLETLQDSRETWRRTTTTVVDKTGVSITVKALYVLKTCRNSVNYSPVFWNSQSRRIRNETFRGSPNRYSLEFVSIPDTHTYMCVRKYECVCVCTSPSNA